MSVSFTLSVEYLSITPDCLYSVCIVLKYPRLVAHLQKQNQNIAVKNKMCCFWMRQGDYNVNIFTPVLNHNTKRYQHNVSS